MKVIIDWAVLTAILFIVFCLFLNIFPDPFLSFSLEILFIFRAFYPLRFIIILNIYIYGDILLWLWNIIEKIQGEKELNCIYSYFYSSFFKKYFPYISCYSNFFSFIPFISLLGLFFVKIFQIFLVLRIFMLPIEVFYHLFLDQITSFSHFFR